MKSKYINFQKMCRLSKLAPPYYSPFSPYINPHLLFSVLLGTECCSLLWPKERSDMAGVDSDPQKDLTLKVNTLKEMLFLDIAIL